MTYDIGTDYDNCDCESRLKFSLPCRHTLIPFARDDMDFTPLRLVHPRWCLRPHYSEDYFVAPANWRPSYREQILRLSPKQTDIYLSLDQVLQQRDALPAGERERFTEQIQTNFTNLLRAAQTTIEQASLPRDSPDVIPKRTFKRKRQADSSRALTAYEIQEEAAKEAERQQRQQERDDQILQQRRQRALEDSQARPSQEVEFFNPAVYQGEILDIDDLEPSPSPSAQPSRPLSLPPAMSEPPPSTAPATLSRGGRPQKKTAKKEAAQAAGYLPESQDRR